MEFLESETRRKTNAKNKFLTALVVGALATGLHGLHGQRRYDDHCRWLYGLLRLRYWRFRNRRQYEQL